MSDHLALGARAAPGETHYRTAGGARAVVAARAAPHDHPGSFVIILAARADDGAGTLMADHLGRPIVVGPHPLTIQSDSAVDVEAAVQRAHAQLLDQLDRAIAHSQAIAALSGVRIEAANVN